MGGRAVERGIDRLLWQPLSKGTQTRAPQWWDHLRKKWKRVFWRRERKAIRQEVKRELR